VTSQEPENPYPQGGWGPPPAPAYGYPGYPGYPPSLPAGMATAALVLGIVALVLCWTGFGGILLGLLAVVFGTIAVLRARRGQGGGQGRAIAGLVTGGLGLVLGAVFLFVWINFFTSSGFSDYLSCVRDAGQDRTKVQQCAEQFQQRYVPTAPTS
jgi:Domain of unknown function (DUF4190)